MNRVIAIVGLGYVGLPIACAFDRAGQKVIGYDIDQSRIEELKKGRDRTQECTEELKRNKIQFTSDPRTLSDSNFVIVAVPTPIDKGNRPDLTLLKNATQTVGENLTKGTQIIFESTVYPGVTEDICVPILETASGLKKGIDFKVGFCPERINPGDKGHTLDKVIKVVSSQDQESLKWVAETYALICKAGIWKAPSIKTAEAAKIIENVQRDLNIALMNELAILFKQLGINTKQVLEAASTKWNFHSYTPGLVGGHCIGVDPYYLTYLAETIDYHPQLILAGRQINDAMADYVVNQLLLGLVKTGKVVNQSKVLILGVTFKENVPDTRNSKVFQVVKGLQKFGVSVFACDPHIESAQMRNSFDVKSVTWPLDDTQYDAILLAVMHRQFTNFLDSKEIEKRLRFPGAFFDLKSVYDKNHFSKDVFYDSL